MANKEHLRILKSGVEKWNMSRGRNMVVTPDLSGAVLIDAVLSHANLSHANLIDTNLIDANLSGTDLSGTDLRSAVLSYANLIDANLSHANLIDADLSGSDLSGANLSHADLSHADLSGADLSHANLSGADLSGSDLRCAVLSYANLIDANLSHADLIDADLSGADLSGADLSGTNLSYANFSYADLSGANLSGTDLSGANLSGTNLSGTNLSGANLIDADLSGAIIFETVFGNIDLSGVKGLDSCDHRGPFIIDFRTLAQSGQLPDVFLKGCGLPDEYIRYLFSLTGAGIRFYSCFISYSTKDEAFCKRLYNDLQGNNVRCWFFPEDATWGKTVWGEIDESIRVYDKLIVVCSENSLNSEPVLREIERGLNREDKEPKNILFPIWIDDYLLHSWKHERKADLTKKVIGDFRNWNKDAAAYDVAFKRLVKALRADDGGREKPPKARL